MKNDAVAEAQSLIKSLRTHTEMILEGAEALQNLKHAIALLSEYAGFGLVFEPGVEPRLVDYLAITIPHTVEGALYGSFAGLILGAIAKRPAEGVVIGAGLGAVVGTMRGMEAVDQGWRVRVQYLRDGSLHVQQL
ncbi:MAG TPA: glycine zipper family protein [Polyangium sp.]|nr:glycine zipper family protein [Polyangium sp.]